MTTDSTSTDDATRRDASACNEGLGPLPPYVYGRECAPNERVWTERDMRAYGMQERAAERAAERERGSVLTDDMLRYAMAALGTGSPQDAERFRAFWLHAMTARDTKA